MVDKRLSAGWFRQIILFVLLTVPVEVPDDRRPASRYNRIFEQTCPACCDIDWQPQCSEDRVRIRILFRRKSAMPLPYRPDELTYVLRVLDSTRQHRSELAPEFC